MSEQFSPTTSSLSQDENQNKDTPTKRTPSKRRSHIDRYQEESKELLKNMGVEELSVSTRRTRSSTKQPVQTPVTPPTPKRAPATPNSSRRGRKKQIEEPVASENDVNDVSTNEQVPPPRKRQKLSETIKEVEEKAQESIAQEENDENPASEIIKESIAGTEPENSKSENVKNDEDCKESKPKVESTEQVKKDEVDAVAVTSENKINEIVEDEKMEVEDEEKSSDHSSKVVLIKEKQVADGNEAQAAEKKQVVTLPEKVDENEAEVAETAKSADESVPIEEATVERMEVDSSSAKPSTAEPKIVEPEVKESESNEVKEPECSAVVEKVESIVDSDEKSSPIETVEISSNDEEEKNQESSSVEDQVNQIESTTTESAAAPVTVVSTPVENSSEPVQDLTIDEPIPVTTNEVEAKNNQEPLKAPGVVSIEAVETISSSNETTKVETSQQDEPKIATAE